MFVYEKKLQYPVKIAATNPKLASFIISQYGGPDGELGASMRYLSQRYAMPYPELKGLLTDIGTEGSFWLPCSPALQHKIPRLRQKLKLNLYPPIFVNSYMVQNVT